MARTFGPTLASGGGLSIPSLGTLFDRATVAEAAQRTVVSGLADRVPTAVRGGVTRENLPPVGAAQPPVAADQRIRLAPLNSPAFYGSGGILDVLKETGGVIFPYTPTVTVTQSVNYNALALVHTNSDIETYVRTPSVEISIAGKFTAQNEREGRYALAAIHFMRVASKMYFGEQDGDMAGLPPPMLLLSGYGTYMFNNLRCILKSHSYPYDENMDTVPVRSGGGITRVPALFTLQCTLTVQQTPTRMRKEFSFNEFRTGRLMERGGWI